LSAGAVQRVLSEPQPRSPEIAREMLHRMDADQDGRVSPIEYEQVSDGLLVFEILDLNRDGALVLWEVDVLVRRLNPTILRPVHGEGGT
jgi:hypothetical protein